MHPPSSTARTVTFWRCSARPDLIFKEALLRLQRDGRRLPEGPNLTQKIFDPVTGLFQDGRRVSIKEWRDGAEFAEHWDGLAFELLGMEPWGIDILRSEACAVLMLRESETDYLRQRESPHYATRWAGLLMELMEAAKAESCLFPIDLACIPRSGWESAVSTKRMDMELRIERQAPSALPARGFTTISLTSGGAITTCLPVKASP